MMDDWSGRFENMGKPLIGGNSPAMNAADVNPRPGP